MNMRFKAFVDSPFGRKLRIAIAIITVIVAIFLTIYSIRWDLFVEQREEWVLRMPDDEISYLLTLKSFDNLQNEVKGLLEIKFSPMNWLRHGHDIKYYFGPLGFWDGSKSILLDFEGGYREIDVMSKMNAITKKKVSGLKKEIPKPIPIVLKPFGSPKFYPFDSYILAGGAYCVIMEEYPPGAPLKPFKVEDPIKNEIMARIEIPYFFVRRVQYDEVKNLYRDQGVKDSDKKLAFERWNKENVFLLKIYRSLFLRVITVLLGVLSLFWVIYVLLTVETKSLPINILAYFIALYSMREILSKGTDAFPTLLDYGILCLFSILIVGTFIKLIWPRKNNHKNSKG